MAALAAIWHVRATRPKLAEGQIDWMYTNTLLPAHHLQEQENAVLLTTTTTPTQMQSMRIFLWGIPRFRGVMTGDILLGA